MDNKENLSPLLSRHAVLMAALVKKPPENHTFANLAEIVEIEERIIQGLPDGTHPSVWKHYRDCLLSYLKR
jgi:hypothetical protein